MNFGFDIPADRRGSDSSKWSVAERELPMSMGDMDFTAPTPVREAIIKRAEHGVFGYTDVNEGLFSAVSDFFARRFSWRPSPLDMVFSTGVVAAISSAVRKLTSPAERVLLMTPVYGIFYNCILNNGRVPLECELSFDGKDYSINFSDLEEKLADPQTSLMILCNPHNPVGRIWTREELARIGELCDKWGVAVVSDEIHCPLTNPSVAPYTPFAAASEVCERISVSCISASKAFNLAGLHAAVVVAKNPILRHKMWREINTSECGEPNCFGAIASRVAFSECDGWLDELLGYLAENRRIAEKYIAENIPSLGVVSSDATYFLWTDASGVCSDSKRLVDFIKQETGLSLSAGASFGRGGEGFLRMNLATARSRLFDGLERLARAVRLFLA